MCFLCMHKGDHKTFCVYPYKYKISYLMNSARWTILAFLGEILLVSDQSSISCVAEFKQLLCFGRCIFASIFTTVLHIIKCFCYTTLSLWLFLVLWMWDLSLLLKSMKDSSPDYQLFMTGDWGDETYCLKGKASFLPCGLDQAEELIYITSIWSVHFVNFILDNFYKSKM